jgi:hypothetical protein
MLMQKQVNTKGLYDSYQESLPFQQNVIAVLFGETFFIENYIKRISHFSNEETKTIF